MMEPPDQPKAQPRHLSDGNLLAIYETLAEQGWPGAAVRLAMLRKKLAAQSEAGKAS